MSPPPSRIVRAGTMGVNVTVEALTARAVPRLVELWDRAVRAHEHPILDFDSRPWDDMVPVGSPLELAVPAPWDPWSRPDAPVVVDEAAPVALVVADNLTVSSRARLVAFADRVATAGVPGAVCVASADRLDWVPAATIGDASPAALAAAVDEAPPSGPLDPGVDARLDELVGDCRRGVRVLCAAHVARDAWVSWGGRDHGWAGLELGDSSSARARPPEFVAGRFMISPAEYPDPDVGADRDRAIIMWRAGPPTRPDTRIEILHVPPGPCDRALYQELRSSGMGIDDALFTAHNI